MASDEASSSGWFALLERLSAGCTPSAARSAATMLSCATSGEDTNGGESAAE